MRADAHKAADVLLPTPVCLCSRIGYGDEEYVDTDGVVLIATTKEV